MFKCEICGKNLNTITGLSNHIAQAKHQITIKNYYLKYMTLVTENSNNKCLTCDKETKFMGMKKGFIHYCSLKCMSNSPIVRNKHKQTCINKYGCENPSQNNEIKRKKRLTLQKNFGKYSNFYPHFSLESQNLFKEIEKQLPETIRCHFATNGSDLETNEYQVLVENKEFNIRFLDFYIPSLNKCIEFDEEHHKNQVDEDIQRENEIRSMLPDIEILRISIEEYNNNFDNTLNKCLEFLNIKEVKYYENN